jgi:hypothetical protein
MLGRFCLRPLLLAGVFLSLTSCNSPSLTSIVISPSAFMTTLVFLPSGAVAPQDEQFWTLYTAIGYYTHPNHVAETRDITSEVTWYSYTPLLVAVNNDATTGSPIGKAQPTGKAVGVSQITASEAGYGGDIISNTSTFTVSLPTTTTTTDVVSLVVHPTASTSATSSTVDFTAVGTTGTGATPTLTGVSWLSSNPGVAGIDPTTGVATTGTTSGQTTITATYTNSDTIQVTGFTTLTVQ